MMAVLRQLLPFEKSFKLSMKIQNCWLFSSLYLHYPSISFCLFGSPRQQPKILSCWTGKSPVNHSCPLICWYVIIYVGSWRSTMWAGSVSRVASREPLFVCFNSRKGKKTQMFRRMFSLEKTRGNNQPLIVLPNIYWILLPFLSKPSNQILIVTRRIFSNSDNCFVAMTLWLKCYGSLFLTWSDVMLQPNVHSGFQASLYFAPEPPVSKFLFPL